MWHFLRRRLLWFLIGFVIAFLVFLFVKYPNDEVLMGMTIAAVSGLGFSILIFLLEKRFPDQAREVLGDEKQS